MIIIQSEPLDVEKVFDLVKSEKAGAVNLFIGTVRKVSKDKNVVRLEYESYDEMVVKEIEKIVDEARAAYPIEKAAVFHRKGNLEVGEKAVIIGVSTPHRKESFEACRFIIDNLKKTVPIWKKEVFDDGEEWVGAGP